MELCEITHPALTPARVKTLAQFQIETLADLLSNPAESVARILNISFSQVRVCMRWFKVVGCKWYKNNSSNNNDNNRCQSFNFYISDLSCRLFKLRFKFIPASRL